MAENTDISVEALGLDLAQIRDLAGLSQQKLGEKLGVDASRISRIEGGKIKQSAVELDKHLRAIGGELATSYRKYRLLDWKSSDRPSFWHPEWEVLNAADEALARLNKLAASLPPGSPLSPQLDMHRQSLVDAAGFLSSVQHDLVFIGDTAAGKSCALCFLTDLVLEQSVGRNRLDDRMVLEGGLGWTTLCEVRIQKGPQYGLVIDPQPESEIRALIRDLCASLSESETADEPDNAREDGSEERMRALRNLMNLNIQEGKDSDGNNVYVDPIVKLKDEFTTPEELQAELFNRIRLHERTTTQLSHEEAPGTPPKEWLKQVFQKVNNGLRRDVSMPNRIDVLIPEPPFGESPFAVRLVDTKGIDRNAIRGDILDRLGDARTVMILCTRFGNPMTSLQGLIDHAWQSGAVNALTHRTVLLVLPRNDEASGMKLPSGERVETDEHGYERNVLRLKPILNRLHANQVPVLHLNATREEDVKMVTGHLEQRIREIRAAHVKQITDVDALVRDLDANHEKSLSQAAHEKVRQELSVLLRRLGSLPPQQKPIYMKLLMAVKGLHYQTVRASVVRNGVWDNLNAYIFLGVGTAADVQARSTKFFLLLHDQIEQMLANEGLAPAHGFLNQLQTNVERWREQFLETCRRNGEELLRTSLYDDPDLWRECEAKRGKGYRDGVADVLQEKGFGESKRIKLLEVLELQVQKQWEKKVLEPLRKLSNE